MAEIPVAWNAEGMLSRGDFANCAFDTEYPHVGDITQVTLSYDFKTHPDFTLPGIPGTQLSSDGLSYNEVGEALHIGLFQGDVPVWIKVAEAMAVAPKLVFDADGFVALMEGAAGGHTSAPAVVYGSAGEVEAVAGSATSGSGAHGSVEGMDSGEPGGHASSAAVAHGSAADVEAVSAGSSNTVAAGHATGITGVAGASTKKYLLSNGTVQGTAPGALQMLFCTDTDTWQPVFYAKFGSGAWQQLGTPSDIPTTFTGSVTATGGETTMSVRMYGNAGSPIREVSQTYALGTAATAGSKAISLRMGAETDGETYTNWWLESGANTWVDLQ